jgi:Methyltransferase domain
VDRANGDAGVDYLAAGAEQIPLHDATVDLATVGAAFHWFGQPRAFADVCEGGEVGTPIELKRLARVELSTVAEIDRTERIDLI